MVLKFVKIDVEYIKQNLVGETDFSTRSMHFRIKTQHLEGLTEVWSYYSLKRIVLENLHCLLTKASSGSELCIR